MIELHAIRKAFNQGHDNEYWALDGIDLSIEANKVTALRGPSGSGKTTLLTILGCLARPTQGRMRLEDEDISRRPGRVTGVLAADSLRTGHGNRPTSTAPIRRLRS